MSYSVRFVREPRGCVSTDEVLALLSAIETVTGVNLKLAALPHSRQLIDAEIQRQDEQLSQGFGVNFVLDDGRGSDEGLRVAFSLGFDPSEPYASAEDMVVVDLDRECEAHATALRLIPIAVPAFEPLFADLWDSDWSLDDDDTEVGRIDLAPVLFLRRDIAEKISLTKALGTLRVQSVERVGQYGLLIDPIGQVFESGDRRRVEGIAAALGLPLLL